MGNARRRWRNPERVPSRRVRRVAVLIVLIAAVFLAVVTQGVTAPTPGLVAEWTGNGTANDSVGASNGTLIGATYAPGQTGQAFSLNGSTDYVNIPSNAMASVTGAISVSARVELGFWIRL